MYWLILPALVVVFLAVLLIRTLRFTTTDLTAAIEEVKKRIRATFKKTP